MICGRFHNELEVGGDLQLIAPNHEPEFEFGAFKNGTHPCIFKGISITLYIEISQEGEGESDRTLRGEPCNVERIPSPISSQRSDGIWSV